MELPRLRLYQQEAMDRLWAAWMGGVLSVVLVLPVGGGKGTLAAWVMLRAALAKGKRVLFVVHRTDLVADIAGRLLKAGFTDLCLHADGRMQGSPSALIHVGMVPTFTASGFRPANVGLVITDEAHRAVARTYRELYAAFPGVPHLGLTATPERGDRTALGDVFDAMIVGATPAELVSQGWLVPVRVVRPPGYNGAQAADPVEAYCRFASGRPGVLFSGRVPHAEDVARRLAAWGYRAACVDGKNLDRRKLVLAQLRRGEIDLVSNVAILTEGFDFPPLEIIVLASGSSSTSAYLQKIGRARRPSPETGKIDSLVIDLYGDAHRFGLPDDHREWSLHGRAVRRATEAPGWTCPACFHVFSYPPDRGVCECGFRLPPPKKPKRRDAELSEEHQIQKAPELYQAFLGFVREGQIKGYKPRFAAMRFKQRFGYFPPFRMPKEIPSGNA